MGEDRAARLSASLTGSNEMYYMYNGSGEYAWMDTGKWRGVLGSTTDVTLGWKIRTIQTFFIFSLDKIQIIVISYDAVTFFAHTSASQKTRY
jgi:hypothetical protein